MTKKDYQAIARAIYRARTLTPDGRPSRAYGAFEVGLYRCVHEIADALAADSPRFDRARFVEACETGRCKGMRAAASPLARWQNSPEGHAFSQENGATADCGGCGLALTERETRAHECKGMPR